MTWTPELYERAKSLRLSGLTARKVGETIGKTEGAVNDFLRRHDRFPPRVDGSWTPERIETATKLWGEGRSASEIANHLGRVTRSAVIGKLHRLGIKRDGAAVPGLNGHRRTSVPKGPRTSRPSRRKTTGFVLQRADRKPVEVRPPAPPSPQEGSTALSVKCAQLGPHKCKWPVGEVPRGCGEDQLHCGAYAESGPYCEGHARAAYAGLPPKKESRYFDYVARRAA